MSLNFLKKKIKTEHLVTKAFKYEKDGITLSFNLHTENKQQLATFEEILLAALSEVQDEMKK